MPSQWVACPAAPVCNINKSVKTLIWSCRTQFQKSDLHLGPLSSKIDVSLMERMTLQVMEVVSMLLVRVGIETKPGLVFRMYLVPATCYLVPGTCTRDWWEASTTPRMSPTPIMVPDFIELSCIWTPITCVLNKSIKLWYALFELPVN